MSAPRLPAVAANSLLLNHPSLGPVEVKMDKKSQQRVLTSFNKWITTEDNTGLSRFMNDATLEVDSATLTWILSPSRMFPVHDISDDDGVAFFEKSAKSERCCQLADQKGKPYIILSQWLKEYISASSFPEAATAIECYLNNLHLLALEFILDESNQFQPWITQLLGEENLAKVPEQKKLYLVTNYIGAVALWLQKKVDSIYGMPESEWDFNKHIGFVLFRILSSTHNDAKDGKLPVFSEFVAQSFRSRPALLRSKKFPWNADEKSMPDEVSKGRYAPSTVDSLNLAYFSKYFHGAIEVIASPDCAEQQEHKTLNKVAFWVFPAEPGKRSGDKIALFRVVKDFCPDDATINTSPTSAELTSLNIALDVYQEAKVDCQKLIIPIAMSAEKHFRLLIIEPAQQAVTFYDSRKALSVSFKAAGNFMASMAQTVGVVSRIIPDAKPVAPSVEAALHYIQESLNIFFKNLEFNEIYTGEQYASSDDCGVYTVRYALDAAIKKVLPINIAASRQQDQQWLTWIYEHHWNLLATQKVPVRMIALPKPLTLKDHELKSSGSAPSAVPLPEDDEKSKVKEIKSAMNNAAMSAPPVVTISQGSVLPIEAVPSISVIPVAAPAGNSSVASEPMTIQSDVPPIEAAPPAPVVAVNVMTDTSSVASEPMISQSDVPPIEAAPPAPVVAVKVLTDTPSVVSEPMTTQSDASLTTATLVVDKKVGTAEMKRAEDSAPVDTKIHAYPSGNLKGSKSSAVSVVVGDKKKSKGDILYIINNIVRDCEHTEKYWAQHTDVVTYPRTVKQIREILSKGILKTEIDHLSTTIFNLVKTKLTDDKNILFFPQQKSSKRGMPVDKNKFMTVMHGKSAQQQFYMAAMVVLNDADNAAGDAAYQWLVQLGKDIYSIDKSYQDGPAHSGGSGPSYSHR